MNKHVPGYTENLQNVDADDKYYTWIFRKIVIIAHRNGLFWTVFMPQIG